MLIVLREGDEGEDLAAHLKCFGKVTRQELCGRTFLLLSKSEDKSIAGAERSLAAFKQVVQQVIYPVFERPMRDTNDSKSPENGDLVVFCLGLEAFWVGVYEDNILISVSENGTKLSIQVSRECVVAI